MTSDDRTLEGADEIAAWIERLWRGQGRRIGVTARQVKYAIKVRGLPAERIGRAWVASSVQVTEWWVSRRQVSALSVLSAQGH